MKFAHICEANISHAAGVFHISQRYFTCPQGQISLALCQGAQRHAVGVFVLFRGVLIFFCQKVFLFSKSCDIMKRMIDCRRKPAVAVSFRDVEGAVPYGIVQTLSFTCHHIQRNRCTIGLSIWFEFYACRDRRPRLSGNDKISVPYRLVDAV